ncbi:DUF262 domain-containing protein [Streptomyces sp. NPDC048251]|uniref:DUF262 domain-containing protein n=1 Tax=Streptomyces sp. NPDC048251 TaxID=3154501 RepID=UPI00343BC800
MRLKRSDLEIEVLYNRITRGDLDLQPDYQRGEVWDSNRRQRLVDTILRDWYVPAIHVVEDAAGAESVLDGQQRLRTIQAFIDGEFRLNGKIDPRRDDLTEYDGKYFRQLPESWRKRFMRFQITVVTLTDYDPAEPAELFFRLNQQYTLTPPEKRNALFGDARDQVKQLVSELSSDLLRKEVIGFSNGRLAYDDVLSRVCIALHEGNLRRQLSNSHIEDFYRNEKFSDESTQRAYAAGHRLGNLLGGEKVVRFNKATLFTWLIFLDSLNVRSVEITPQFIREFEALRSGVRLSDSDESDGITAKLAAVAKTYSDRASYRVLDVTSVLLRDFALHVAHAALTESGSAQPELLSFVNALDSSGEVEDEMWTAVERLHWGTEL